MITDFRESYVTQLTDFGHFQGWHAACIYLGAIKLDGDVGFTGFSSKWKDGQMSNTRANALRHSLTAGVVLATVLFAGRAPAATMEEVTAHGTTTIAAAQQAHLEAEMASYVRKVEIEIKDSVQRSLEQSSTPGLRLAQLTASNRG